MPKSATSDIACWQLWVVEGQSARPGEPPDWGSTGLGIHRTGDPPDCDPPDWEAPVRRSCVCPRVPGSQGPRVPGSHGPRVPGSQGPMVPGSQGPRVPGSQGPRVPWSQGPRFPGPQVSGLDRPPDWPKSLEWYSGRSSLRDAGLARSLRRIGNYAGLDSLAAPPD